MLEQELHLLTARCSWITHGFRCLFCLFWFTSVHFSLYTKPSLPAQKSVLHTTCWVYCRCKYLCYHIKCQIKNAVSHGERQLWKDMNIKMKKQLQATIRSLAAKGKTGFIFPCRSYPAQQNLPYFSLAEEFFKSNFSLRIQSWNFFCFKRYHQVTFFLPFC